MTRTRAAAIWSALIIAVVVPFVATALSPLLAWRDPVYIIAGFAGAIALSILLFQPLLAIGYLPLVSDQRSRFLHRCIGSALVISVLVHVIGLWLTSPPDVIDALLFASPTPFSFWGVIAMWAIFATACLTAFRRKLRLRPRTWRLGHKMLAVVIVVGSVVHAIMIEGTMELLSKSVLCALVLAATASALISSRRKT